MCEPTTIAMAISAAAAAYGASQMGKQRPPNPGDVKPPAATADPYKSPETTSSDTGGPQQTTRRQLKTDLTIGSSSAGLQTRPTLTIGGH